MKFLERLQLLLAALAVLASAAHVLELPNKLMLDGPLWLAVQQHLYRGWGPFFGAPVEISALATSLWLAVRHFANRAARSAFIAATAAYIGMIAVFFILNAPVNNVISAMAPADLPLGWPALRLRWEVGHAIAAALALFALAVSLRAWPQRRFYMRAATEMNACSSRAGRG